MSTAIAELSIEVKGARSPMKFAIHKPRWIKRMNAWGCRVTFSRPFEISTMIYGENSTQALVLALKFCFGVSLQFAALQTKEIGFVRRVWTRTRHSGVAHAARHRPVSLLVRTLTTPAISHDTFTNGEL